MVALIIFLAVLICAAFFSSRYGISPFISVREDPEMANLEKQLTGIRIMNACNSDDVNFYMDCLVRFASQVYGRDIPVYEDGDRWKPGDIVDFHPILSDNTYRGEVVANIDDEGLMRDRCPVCIRIPGWNKDGRTFDAGQVSAVRLHHRPDHFAEMVGKSKGQEGRA